MTDAPLVGLRVVHLGHLDPGYSRNRIVAKALRRAGAEVRTVTDHRPYARRTPTLLRDLLRTPADLVLVGFPGHADVALAKAVGTLRRVPVLFDAFVSLQESADDRGRALTEFARRRLVIEDHIAGRLADGVLVDTNAHAEHFVADVGVDPRKVWRLWVGADDDVMRPLPTIAHNKFRVFVYASFIPLHGLEHVVRAAAVLEMRGTAVDLEVVGDGATATAVQALAEELRVRSVRFVGRLPYEELPVRMAGADVCLGVFGTSLKAQRVIPNKVFDALACARPVITGDTRAVRELLQPGEDVWLCAPGDPEALADAIVTLRDNDALRVAIGQHGHARFRETASIDALARTLADVVTHM